MEYSYYPGCSVHSTAPQYEASTQAVMEKLGIKLHEIDDWNCCGATAYMGVKELTSFAISARNLAMVSEKKRSVITPCSGCYVVLQKTNKYMNEFPDVKEKVNTALSEGKLSYDGDVDVKHVLETFITDYGLENLKKAVTKPLKDLKVACYSGCQLSRPAGQFDDPESPTTLEAFIEALGATATKFPLKAACCSGSVMGTEREAGILLSKNILECAHHYGAECIVVPCPLCQMNLDAYHNAAKRKYGKSFNLPVLYFTQLLGLALGIEPDKLGFGKEIISASHIVKRFA